VPAVGFDAELLKKSAGIALLILDVDGVLTDGGLSFDANGENTKRFNALDGHGIKLLQACGVAVAVISGRDGAPLRKRLDALGVTRRALGVHAKVAAAQAMLADLNLTWAQTAAMGDDWPDLGLLSRCALALAPANAHAEVKALAHHTTRAQGGHGAVREVCDLLLTAQGHYQQELAKALADGQVHDTTTGAAT
jgi:3-deoxy-D-manno-octulosonate 8-phosphate phosphatase (KDO 8-P phosphatase)